MIYCTFRLCLRHLLEERPPLAELNIHGESERSLSLFFISKFAPELERIQKGVESTLSMFGVDSLSEQDRRLVISVGVVDSGDEEALVDEIEWHCRIWPGHEPLVFFAPVMS